MSQPWLEDLSEEWIPQPTPPTLGQGAANPSTTQKLQSVPPKPRSLLPRLRHSSGSFPNIQVHHITRDLKPTKRRSALAERSLSDNNISSTMSAGASNGAPSRNASQSFSASSLDSVIHDGTVAQNPISRTPAKNRPIHETPEWRRRLLKGDIGYGDQKDLFSPMGLENIFQKPHGDTSEDTKQCSRKLSLFQGFSAMPSSPPPWPSSEQQDREAPTHNWPRTGFTGTIETEKDPNVSHNDSSQVCSAESFSMHVSAADQYAPPRTASGQTEFENENFSPVYLTANLKVGSAPKPVPNFKGSELAQRLRQLGSPAPSQGPDIVLEEYTLSQSQRDSSFAKIQDDSLPEDLPAGTPDLAEVGRFVEVRRGGYSQDGSFRRRALSPSPQSKAVPRSMLENEITQEESIHEDIQSVSVLDGSSVLPKAQSPTAPATPHRQGRQTHLSPLRAQNSGSPLKLFDAHDTFTSNRLQRRLSQLEYKTEKLTSGSLQVSKTDSTKVIEKAFRLTSVEEVSTHGVQRALVDDQKKKQHRVGTFGHGQLNKFQFSEDWSALSSQASDGQDTAPDESPSIDTAPPGSRQPLNFQFDRSPSTREPSRTKRQGLTRVSNPFRGVSYSKPHTANLSSELVPQYECAEGKRGPTSPFKNPAPKRRRTLHSLENDEDDVFSDTGLKSVKDSHVAMQSIIGRKRKDARHDHSSNIADPEVLARRHILRPRNPTPSQRRKDEIHAEIMEATEAFLLSSPKLNTVREQLDSPVGSGQASEEKRAIIVANEVAAFSMKQAQGMREETRKRSVTTQDFLDEAVKIMDYIRAKGRPTSGLGSLEESESESPVMQRKYHLPSTPLTFDRPPSREGRMSAWKEPNKHELDSNVMSHLRKYQEKESDEFMGSFIRSLRFANMNPPIPPEQEGHSVVIEQDGIRITDNPDRHNKLANGNDDDRINSQSRTTGTHPSTASSMGHTVATSASRRSDHVATLAPEAVAHLIPQQIAGMSFDREKNIWVRQKSPSKEHRPVEEYSTNESEEDPFGNIPDLTVDETAELQINKTSASRPRPTAETFLESEDVEVEAEEKARPITREGRATTMTDTSSVPSKFSNFAWSYPKTETRATSWSDQEARNGGTQKLHQPPTTYAIPESNEDDVEHEIKYFEGRGVAKPAIQSTRVRDITISIAERDFESRHETQRTTGSPPKHGRKQNYPSVHRNPHTNTPWRPNMGPKTLSHTRRPKVAEDSDLSILEDLPAGNYRMQLSMSVSAPALVSSRRDQQMTAPSSPAKGDMTFILSDLPEFTLNQVDECEIPDRIVIKHDGTKFSKALEDRYALGTAELVKALQDVEPDEPYWEDLREVDLHEKNLLNLHRLGEFCYRLEDLDVSGNSISQVRGIPFSTRRLRARGNCLSGLTSWSALINLQHLDVSSNDIDCLDGLSELIHLRTLKVDDNKIRSLEGVLHLDGLMELSAGGNKIEEVDFAKSNLKSLTELNLRCNRLLEVRNVQCLPQLQHLDLDDNCIESLPAVDAPVQRCSALRTLRLCRNGLLSLGVDCYFPKLESLHVDGNSLTDISGLEHLRHLRTFSGRDQKLNNDSDTETCVGNLMRNSDVRNLYISLNPTRCLDMTQHLLNLQRLELSSMGLKELPDNFGQLAPNLRFVNLNFNSIKDLRPLLNIKRLDELLLAGNKLERLRASAIVLGKLGTLSKLDWRDNPLTLRFYAPASENRLMSLRHRPSDEQTTDRFVLLNGDPHADKQYLSRLDYETRIRRRVTEMMLANFCRNLRELDGLPFDKARVLVKDDVWERLLFLGVIQRKPSDNSEEITE